MNKPIITGDTITIPSDQDFLADVDMFIEGILRGWNIDESIIADIAISVSELVNNAICHGNKLDISKKVKVRITRDDKAVIVRIGDQGNGFNPTEVANPVDDENLLKEVGRGIFIVKSLMDSVEYESLDDGSEVIIKKAI